MPAAREVSQESTPPGKFMAVLLCAVLILLGSSLISFALRRIPHLGDRFGAVGALIGSGLGLLGTALALSAPEAPTLYFAMSLPGAALYLKVDGLSGFFLLILFFGGVGCFFFFGH